ncbi:MAG: hypothetical protein H0U21_11320, partial [Acidimicrobiia bacterium]|nr:hypothetical protein [Acidimicrobiia bacterium]
MPADPAYLTELIDRLGARLEALTTGDEWLSWLSTARSFHRYSPANQVLLALQGADGHVASYRTWQRLTDVDGNPCQVARGEKGLSILAPLTVTRRDIDEATGDEIVVGQALRGFKVVKVFHQGQLVAPPAIPAPVMPKLLTGDDRHQHVWAVVVAHLEGLGYDVSLVTRPPFEEWNGRTNFRHSSVDVADHLEPPQRLKTLMHEWAHIALEHDLRPGLPPSAREIEAESVAYLWCSAVGVDSADYTV